MTKLRPILALVACSLAPSCVSFREPVEDLVPLSVLRTLRGPESFEVLTLDPHEVKSRAPKDARIASEVDFHGFEILGHAPMIGPPRRELVELVLRGIQEGRGGFDGPFEPRHGIRAVKEGRVLDVLVCYECRQVSIYSAELVAQHGRIDLSTSTSVAADVMHLFAEAGLENAK